MGDVGSKFHKGARAFICGVAAIALLAWAAQAATALETRSFEEGFGADGTASSTFLYPWSLAVDQTTGRVYAASLESVVRGFSVVAHTPEALPNVGFGLSPISEQGNQIAVNSTTHDFYVVGLVPEFPVSVRAFHSNGESADFSAGSGAGRNEIGSEVCGVATDPNGDIYISELSSGLHIFAPDGEELTSYPSVGECNLAVDSHGYIYIAPPRGPVEKLEPSTFPVTSATTYASAGVVDSGEAFTVAVNPANDHLLVDEGNQIAEYDEDGGRLGSFGGNMGLVGSVGMAVYGASERVYVSNSLGGSAQVYVFGPTFLVKPKVNEEEAIDLTGSSADLQAKLDPEGLKTSCELEYGTTTEYSTKVECEPASLEGLNDLSVKRHIEKLKPNITYHWRIVATSEAGTTTSSDNTFVYDTSGESLPDHRAYEMVTPPTKNAALIGNVFVGVHSDISEDGSRLIMSSLQCFAGAESCTGSRETEGEQFLFSRTDTGWATTALAPPATQFEANSGWLASAESGMELFSMPTSPMSEDDFYVRHPDGSFVDIGPATPPANGAQGEPWSVELAATGDFSHVVFQEEDVWPFAQGSTGLLAYELSGSGNPAPVLVGVSGGPGSTALTSHCGTVMGGSLTGGLERNPGEMSADGEKVFFTAIACGSEVPANILYARIGAARTVKISERSPTDCTTTACTTSPVSNALLDGASNDGSKVFFTSGQQLTDDASAESSVEGNLYEYDFDNPTGENLIDVSKGDTSGHGPRVQGVMAISADGSHVFFVAKGVLTTMPNMQGQVANEGPEGYNLYMYERDANYPAGEVKFVTRLPEADSEQWTREGDAGRANVTPNGRFLVFESHGPLTPDDTAMNGAVQIFRYDAETGELLRVSSGERGFNDNGNVGVGNAKIVQAKEGWLRAGEARSDPTMSHDGSFIFFESPLGLTPHALNDVEIKGPEGRSTYAENVYEWHEGQVSLISDGRDVSGEGRLLGSDATGRNVFFSTVDALVPSDTDTQLDYYDARVCEPEDPCITSSPPGLPPCLGEVCHGTPVGLPPVASVPTATFNGPGNVGGSAVVSNRLKKCPKGRHRVRGKCVKVKKKRKKTRRQGRKAGFGGRGEKR